LKVSNQTWKLGPGISTPISLLRFFLIVGSIVLTTLATAKTVRANDVYVAQSTSGANDGSNCANAFGYTYFNSNANWVTGSPSGTMIGPGTTVHICGTINAPANGNLFVFQGSGTSGNPVTLLFEPNGVLQSPVFQADGGGTGCGGAICMYNRSYVVVDGGTNGIIRNTDNGDTSGHNQASAGIDGYKCNNCIIRNISILNLVVKSNSNNGSTPGDQVHTITMSGSHWSVHDTVSDHCGWCIFQNFGNGDTDIDIYNNKISHMDHGWMFASSSSNSAVGPIKFHDNQVHDTSNWDTPGCDYHHDGIHTFGVPGSSYDGLYIYNNYFYGNWGSCPTGFIYLENGSSNPSHAKSWAVYNNVGIVGAGSGVNTNGWFGLFSGESGTQLVFNNTIIGLGANDNTMCLSMQTLSGLSYQNNLVTSCGDPVEISSSNVNIADYNVYGTSCGNGNNCFVYNSQFKGSFSGWKSACNCDSHSTQNDNLSLNSDGSPLLTSLLATFNGSNLSALTIGPLTGLARDTSKGNTRATTARPSIGSWTAGAYSLGSTATQVSPPNLLSAVVQ